MNLPQLPYGVNWNCSYSNLFFSIGYESNKGATVVAKIPLSSPTFPAAVRDNFNYAADRAWSEHSTNTNLAFIYLDAIKQESLDN